MKQFGFKGALITGCSDIGDGDKVRYLDEPPVWKFWERIAALDVFVYLHPRIPQPSQQRIYEGFLDPPTALVLKHPCTPPA